MVVMLTFMSKCAEWLLPMANRIYCGNTRVLGEIREVSRKGRRDHTFAATMGGALHQTHIRRGVMTEEKALLSSKAEAAMRPVSAWTFASEVPPSIPWFSLSRQSDHQ